MSLERWVTLHNFYRHLEAKLDLGFVRGWVRDLYADCGRPGIDPVVSFNVRRPRARLRAEPTLYTLSGARAKETTR